MASCEAQGRVDVTSQHAHAGVSTGGLEAAQGCPAAAMWTDHGDMQAGDSKYSGGMEWS